MENKVRETVLLSTLGEDVASYLAWEGGIYNEAIEEWIYEEIEEEITYTDLEKCYQNITKIFKRTSDSKFFKWKYMYSYHINIKDHCDKELTEVFPYTHEVTGYL